MKKFQLGPVIFDVMSYDAALQNIFKLTVENGCSFIITANADHVVRAAGSSEYTEICRKADLVFPDGMPVVWAAKLMGIQGIEKVSGSDLVPSLCEAASQNGTSVFFLGGAEGEAELAAKNLKEKNPSLKVAGVYYPPFGFESNPKENDLIVELINKSGAGIVFVGVGSPKQEKWILANKHRLQRCVCIGVGISISIAAGNIKRAPVVMQISSTEWIYRLYQEPKRLAKRYIRDIAIVGIAFKSIRKHRRDVGQKSE